MWTSESSNAGSSRNEDMRSKSDKNNEKARKSNLDPLELLMEDLHLHESEAGKSGATTEERTLRPEDQYGLSSIDTLNEWDQSFPQMNRRSPSQRAFHSSIDREFEYHGQPKWSSLEVTSPSLNNSRGEPFLQSGFLSSRSQSQESIQFTNNYGNIGSSMSSTYDSYQSPIYPRQSIQQMNSPANNFFSSSAPLAAARPQGAPHTPSRAPRSMEPVDGFIYQVW